MALAAINGSPVISAVIAMPLVGAWTIDAVVDSQEAISGVIEMVIDGGLTLKGTTRRSENYLDSIRILAVAGAAGLQSAATPQFYQSTTVGAVLGDLLGSVDEQLDPSAATDVLGASLESWTTVDISVGRVIARAMASGAPGASWRFLPSGTVWAGAETWPDSGLSEDDYQIVSEDPENASAVLGVDTFALLPGTALAGRHVSYVEHRLDAECLRTRVWFDEGGDRLLSALGAVVKGASNPIDYHALYLARVVNQEDDIISVQPDADGIPTMNEVKLLTGTPGTSVLMAGGRVLVGWSGGDPAHPFALTFDSETSAATIVFEAGQAFLGGQDGAEPAIKGVSYRTAQTVLHAAIQGACAGAAGAGATEPALVAFAAALAAALTAFEAGAPSYLAVAALVK